MIKSKINNKLYSYRAFKKHLTDNNTNILDYVIKNEIPIILYDYKKILLTNKKCKNCNKDLLIKIKKDNKFYAIGCSNKCISKYGINEKYYRDLRSRLIPFIGITKAEEIFKIKIKKRKKFSKKRLINQFGVKEGNKKWEEYIEKIGQKKSNFIKRYGEKEGIKKYNKFVEKSKHTKEKYIKKYDEKEGVEKWEKFILNKKLTSPRRKEYWVNKGYTEEESKILIKEFQNNNSLEAFKNRYGDYEGYIKYQEFIKRNKNKVYKSFIKKYGEEKGRKKYKEYRKKINFPFSKQSNKLFKEIETYLKDDIEIFYGEKEYHYLIPNKYKIKQSSFFFDFYIPKYKIIIEYFGDKFHANPKIYEKFDTPHPYNKEKSYKIWERDNERIEILKKENFNILIIWEYDFINNKKQVLINIMEFLKNYDIIKK